MPERGHPMGKRKGISRMGIYILILLFFVLLLFPIAMAGVHYKWNKAEILYINQDKVRNARYFGLSFMSMMEDRLEQSNDNQIQLSKLETFIEAGEDTVFAEELDKLFVSRKECCVLPAGINKFHKEIYASGDLIVDNRGIVQIRAAASRKHMILGNNTQIVRWVDAEGTLAIYDNCELGISASAGVRMSVGRGCRFQRLYSPEIYLGQYPDELNLAEEDKNPKIYHLPIQMDKEKNVRYITKDMINEEGIVGVSVLAWKNLRITEDIIVQGHVRSHQGVRLCDRAVVCGNVFAEKDVYLGKNACVLGSIFSQGNIYFEEGAVVGRRGRIVSVIARGSITFEKKNFVFGYVSCEEGGMVKRQGNDIEKTDYHFLDLPPAQKRVEFKNREEFEAVAQQGFRFHKDLKEAVLPDGAWEIPSSQFFSCKELQNVELPDTIQKIGDYAFADCGKLQQIDLRKQGVLREIGTSAFENCYSLEEIEIPGAVKYIGGAAFAGCRNLKTVRFSEPVSLKRISDHCFRGCENLRNIELPESVREIGISAFLGCPIKPELSGEKEIDDAYR